MKIVRAWHTFAGSVSPIIDITNVSLDWTGLATLSGASGSGKTTLFRVLCGWYDDDLTICQFDPPLDRFRRIRFVGAHDSLLPWRSVEGNLRFHGFSSADIDSALAEVGFGPEIRSRPVYELSFGMYKRIELVIAIAERPELLLLDEFFSSIDDDAKTVIRDYVLSTRPQDRTWVIAHERDLRRWLSPTSYSLVIDQKRRCVIGIEHS